MGESGVPRGSVEYAIQINIETTILYMCLLYLLTTGVIVVLPVFCSCYLVAIDGRGHATNQPVGFKFEFVVRSITSST